MLRSASNGVLQVSDPCLLSLLQNPSLRDSVGKLQFRRGISKIPGHCSIWPQYALELLAHPFNILAEVIGRPFRTSQVGMRPIASMGSDESISALVRQGRELLETVANEHHAKLQLKTLHLLSSARSLMQEQRRAMQQLLNAIHHLSTPRVQQEIALILRACLDVGRALDTSNQGARIYSFAFESLASIANVKSRFHPHYCLRDAVACLFREKVHTLFSTQKRLMLRNR